MMQVRDLKGDGESLVNYKFSADFEEIAEDWKQIETMDHLSQNNYLSFTTRSITNDIRPYFGIAYHDDIPVHGFLFHLKKITLTDSIRDDGSNFFIKLLKRVSKSIIEQFSDIYTLTCGNLFVTGEYSIVTKETLSNIEKFGIIGEATRLLAKQIEQCEKINIGLHLFKDFYDTEGSEVLDAAKFSVQPNMLLDIRWAKAEEYIQDFKSKYRVRFKKARKKFKGLVDRELSLDEIEKFESRINELYRNVSDNAGFNLFILSPDYFYKLKKAMSKEVKVVGYFNEQDHMVAFFSLIDNHHELEAHFLGYDGALNSKHQLYQNMLFDIVEYAIRFNFKKVNFSRTALEIKSTVGAYPREMFLLMRHKNKFLNKLLPRLISYFMPKYDFVLRSPFK